MSCACGWAYNSSLRACVDANRRIRKGRRGKGCIEVEIKEISTGGVKATCYYENNIWRSTLYRTTINQVLGQRSITVTVSSHSKEQTTEGEEIYYMS